MARTIAAACLGLAVLSLSATVQAAEPSLSAASSSSSARLEAALARIAKGSNGTLGVAMQPLGGGPVTGFNIDQRFPMASTFKIALAGVVFTRIDAGKESLDRMVAIGPKDLVYSDGVATLAVHPGISLSVYNLLELMLTRSDNTATDALLREVGGPQVVTAWLRAQGIEAMRVDSGTAGLIYRALKITPGNGTFVENVLAQDPHVLERDLSKTPNAAFDADPRDQASPRAMLALLQRVHSGKVLSPQSTKALLGILGRCVTGEHRIKGLLPPSAKVEHKTGTLLGIANDVGFVTLPDGRVFALVVFIKGDSLGSTAQDRVIAEVARTAYDYFTLQN